MEYRLGLLNDEKVLALSNGEVKNFGKYLDRFIVKKAEPNGLFCQKIFGPIVDYTCECGITKKVSNGEICSVCNVPYISSYERNNRFGHIELNTIILPPMAIEITAIIWGLSKTKFKDFILNNKGYIGFVEDDKGRFYSDKNKRFKLVLSEDKEKGFTDNLYEMLLEAETLSINPYVSMMENSNQSAQIYFEKGFDIFSMLLSKFPVSPAGMRDRKKVGEDLVYHEDNLIYHRIIREALRIGSFRLEIQNKKELRELIAQETKIIQKLINGFILTGYKSNTKQQIEPKVNALNTKDGLLRSEALGKRIDFSGRSVITSGPFLPIDTVGVPMAMLIELFTPDLIRELTKKYMSELKIGKIKALRKAKSIIKERNDPILYDLVEAIQADYMIMMNRAPSLHRFSVMSFRIKPTFDKCFYFPPMAMKPFGADCITSNTKIHTLDYGAKTIPELIDIANNDPNFTFFVWSRDKKGKQVPGVAHSPRLIRNVNEIYKITLDNDEYFECTGNHKIMLKNGEYVQAKDLQEGDSVSPFYWVNDLKVCRYNEDESTYIKRKGVYDEELGWQQEHWLSYERFYLDSRKGYQLHHIDFNPDNNSPLNLLKCSAAEHLRIHGAEYNGSEKQKLGVKGSKVFVETHRKTIIDRNKELKSKEVAEWNKNQEFKDAISVGWQARSLGEIYGLGYNKVTEEIFNLHRPGKLKDIEKLGGLEKIEKVCFDNYYHKQAEIYFKLNPISNVKTYKVTRKNNPINFLSVKNIYLTLDLVLGKLLDKGLEVNKTNFEKEAWENELYFYFEDILKVLNRPLDLYIKTRNHKVKCIDILKVENEPVYDITVDVHHNYALSSGVYVHNCDGDQLACYIVHSAKARKELRENLSFSHNIMSTADRNKPNANMAHEMIVGSFLLTKAYEDIKEWENKPVLKYYNNSSDIETDYYLGYTKREDKIVFIDNGQKHIICVGAGLIHLRTGIIVDYLLGKNGISKLISTIGNKYDEQPEIAVKMLTDLQTLFFETATKYGLSIAYHDCEKPKELADIINQARYKAENTPLDVLSDIEKQGERVPERAVIWDKAFNECVDRWFNETPQDNALQIMGKAGARVTDVQVKAMILGKGLQSTMDNKLDSNAIYKGLSEGLDPISYMKTCGPARRGFASNMAVVPSSGYGTRQFVTCTRDLSITTEDCENTSKGIILPKEKALYHYDLNNKLITENNLHTYNDYIEVRSPITCKHTNGLCKKCCGVNLKNGKDWELNLGIGTIAAQTIMEILTQMSLSYKHISGSVNLKTFGTRADNLLADFFKFLGARSTQLVPLSMSLIEDTILDLQGATYEEKASNFVLRCSEILKALNMPSIWYEILGRGLSNIVFKGKKAVGYRHKGYFCDSPEFVTMFKANTSSPSWLKGASFGYTKDVIRTALLYNSATQGLITEKIIEGRNIIND